MGRKLNISNLTEEEAEHVLQVVQRDMQLRKTEEERLSELKQELDQEESRCVLLSRQHGFNERCCIRCCSSFTLFLKPRRRCLDCRYNICKRCCSYSETDKSWLCSTCQKSRLLKTQSLEWFYSNVRRRFRRFGSAKVLKMLYRRHVGDQGSQAEFTEGSTYADSTDDSVYESDSTFYKHTEERSMAESISVALRVAKEAIDEAISKAEKHTGNQEKLKQACYLRDNRGELIDELTTMILQTIICRRRDQSEMHAEYNLEPPSDQNSNSQSAFSLLTDEILAEHDKAEQSSMLCIQGLNKDDVPGIASWNQNIDWMENSCASSVLQSPDGNWFALQSTQLSRLSLPTKRENLMFSSLEKESGVISAYDRMASDTESDNDGACGTARVEIDRKLSSTNHAINSQLAIKLPTKNTCDQPQSDSDQNNSVAQIHKSLLPVLKRKVSIEERHWSSQCHSAKGFISDPDGGESSEDGFEDTRVKRTRRRKRNKCEASEGKVLTVCSGERLPLTETQDYGRMLLNYLLKCQSRRQSVSELLSDDTMNADTSDSVTSDILKSGAMTPNAFIPDVDDPNTVHHVLSGASDQQLTSKLRELANGTRLALTKNKLDDGEERVDEIYEKRKEKMKEERENEIKGALLETEVDAVQEDSVEEDKGQKPDKRLPDFADNEVGKNEEKIRISETLRTNMIDHLHKEMLQETVEKQSAIKIENVDQGTKNRSVKKQHSVKNVAHIEPEAQSILETDKEIETTVERCWKSEKPEIQEGRKHKKVTEFAAGSKQDSADRNAGGEKSMNKEKERGRYSPDNLHFADEGNSGYKKMIDNVAKGFNIVEDGKEAHNNTRYRISALTDEVSNGNEEIMGSQLKQNQVTKNNEMGFHNERMDKVEQTQESDVKNENRGRCVEKTEKHNNAAEAERCNDQTLKDVLDCVPSGRQEFLSPEEIYKKYSAASLRSITTEVLKVLNATEDLIQGAVGVSQSESLDRPALPPTQSKRLDEQLSRLEENVYVAASAVFGLEAELGDLEECSRSISGETTEEELSQLEEKVASAAAQVQQSELQVSDIAARIAALKNAGLNVAPQTRFAKPQTIDSSRQFRRRLPAPPTQGKKT